MPPFLKSTVLAALMLTTGSANAATFFVTNANDAGAGSLRQIIQNANTTAGASHRIVRAANFSAPATVFLESALPSLDKPMLELDLPDLTLEPDNPSASFRLLTAGATLTDLTLRNFRLRLGVSETGNGGGCLASAVSGSTTQTLQLDNMQFSSCTARGGNGGALFWTRGSVTIFRSDFIDNVAIRFDSSLARGGAVQANDLTIDDSVFANNQAESGGLVFGGAIYSSGTLDIRNARFTQNRAMSTVASGGAIYAACSGCSHLIQRSYFGRNRAANGGAIGVDDQSAPFDNNAMTLANLTIDTNETTSSGAAIAISRTRLLGQHLSFQDNIAGAAAVAHLSITGGSSVLGVHNSVFGRAATAGCAGSANSTGFGNITTDSSCTAVWPLSNQVAISSVVGTVNLFDAMPVIRYARNSPAIDSASLSFCLPTDARGTTRPIDGNGDGIAACDVGAFEREPVPDLVFRNGFEQGA